MKRSLSIHKSSLKSAESMRTLVAHHWMGCGGSEATAMWVLQALQDRCDLTFATAAKKVDWDSLNAAYGTEVNPKKVRLKKAPGIPMVNSPDRLVYMQLAKFQRYCKKIAGNYDLCVSAYNPIDFGRPGIQLIGDFSFDEEMRCILNRYGTPKFRHKDTLLRRLYIGFSNRIGTRARAISKRKDLVLANSKWSAMLLDKRFNVRDAPVIYPPVTLPMPIKESRRNPLGFVCLGRVSPEKELERIISILKQVREKGHAITLTLVGHLGDTRYERKISALVQKNRDWIIPTGFLNMEEKRHVLSRNSFALHGCRIEAFGIAVAEMASMGCIPFVPDMGGAGEIVREPELQFGTEEEAVEKIVYLLERPKMAEQFRLQLSREMDKFGPKVFMREFLAHVNFFQSNSLDPNFPPSASDVSQSQNQAAFV